MTNLLETDGHLTALYHNWKKSPELYEDEVTKTFDKIIYSTLVRQSNRPHYKRYESWEDTIQDLRLLCWNKFNNLKEPITNKRIFNFLRISIRYYLADKSRKVGKQLDREYIENDILGNTLESETVPFSLGDATLDKVAYLLSAGEPKTRIQQSLGLTRNKLTKMINQIKTIYMEENHE